MEIISIFVKNLPPTCYQCTFLVMGTKLMCITNRKVVEESLNVQLTERPSWCPLREPISEIIESEE